MDSYQVVALSGGGAKGPYGLGVLLALQKFYQERKKKVTRVYCGTSVGALNASLAAQGDLGQLNSLYRTLRTKDILGTSKSEVSLTTLGAAFFRKPFHYFKNDALRDTISKYAKFDRLEDANLLICVTNYLTGSLETFYRSQIVEDFIAMEAGRLNGSRKLLSNFHRIEGQEQLVDVLLASASIPFYFPPVKLNGSLFVDGGVGNNTPLRQAAYMYRFLKCTRGATLEPTVCVVNDPHRFVIEPSSKNIDLFGVVRRTMEIFHNEIVSDSRFTWDRNNADARETQDRLNRISSALALVPDTDLRAKLHGQLSEIMLGTGSDLPRVDIELLDIRPSGPLLADVLCFDPEKSTMIKHQGIEDCLNVLHATNRISHKNRSDWASQID